MIDINLKLPEGFLNDEIRNDYLVDKQMKEVWAIELDLLNELKRVCSIYNINFFAEGGTILGAVRHGGFIPWDDDIDIAMSRKDYEVLCAHASDFKEPYFLQTNYTDEGSVRGHAQLRNSLTTGALESETKIWINQGIFIDIFPLDNIPDENYKFKKQVRKIDFYKKNAFFFGKNLYIIDSSKGIKKAIKEFIKISRIDKFTKKIGMHFYKKMEKMYQMYDDIHTQNITIFCLDIKRERYIRPKKDYEEQIIKDFEFMTIPLPKGYDSVLKKYYGDYSKMIRGMNAHGRTIFSTDYSYKIFLKEKYNNKYY